MFWTLFGLQLLITLLAACHVVLQQKRPTIQLAWIMFIAFLPLLGIGAYIFFGSDRLIMRRQKRRFGYNPLREEGFQAQAPDTVVPLPEYYLPLFTSLQTFSRVGPTVGNVVEVLDRPQDFYEHLRTQIETAEQQIWFCIFVFRDDYVGRLFIKLLTAAATRGVEVRVLVDELGSRTTPEELFAPLVEAGGHFSWATTLYPRRNRWFVNLRNHRKIIVIDGRIVYSGGMNIGSEYVDGINGMVWNDIQIAVQGPAVTQLAAVFADDWHYATEERLLLCARCLPHASGVSAQLVAGGPDHPRPTNARAIQAMILAAERRVVLTTPYFVPDEELLATFELATARGVRVELNVSAESDMGPLLLLSRSFFARMLAAGVRICEYQKDIHHAKLVLVDDEICMVGSINLDVRSFHLNYEVALVFHDPALTKRLQAYIDRNLATAEPLQLKRFRRRPLRMRLKEGFLRLLAPLM